MQFVHIFSESFMKSKIETITKTTQAHLDKEALNHASSLSESELLKKPVLVLMALVLISRQVALTCAPVL